MAAKKSFRLYEINDMVNFRLRKDREDVMNILNAKKMAGEDISEYLVSLIREKEGLIKPTPSSPPPPPIYETPPTIDINEIVQKVIIQLTRQGLVINPSQDTTTETAASTINDDIRNAVQNIMRFGDDDDD